MASYTMSQCTYRCVVLPDRTAHVVPVLKCICLNAPTGAWCSLTRDKRDDRLAENSLNAPTGAWCSLTDERDRNDQAFVDVSMHLQVRGAP